MLSMLSTGLCDSPLNTSSDNANLCTRRNHYIISDLPKLQNPQKLITAITTNKIRLLRYSKFIMIKFQGNYDL
jgi:hypothetical protein